MRYQCTEGKKKKERVVLLKRPQREPLCLELSERRSEGGQEGMGLPYLKATDALKSHQDNPSLQPGNSQLEEDYLSNN